MQKAVEHAEMTAIDFAVTIMGCKNDIQEDHFMTEYRLEKREKILIFSTGFVMTYKGRIVMPELPVYAAPFFWTAVTGGSLDENVYDKHTPRQHTASIQRASPRRTAPETIISLEKANGQFVLTKANGNIHSNPDLKSLMEEIGTTVEALESQGVEVSL